MWLLLPGPVRWNGKETVIDSSRIQGRNLNLWTLSLSASLIDACFVRPAYRHEEVTEPGKFLCVCLLYSVWSICALFGCEWAFAYRERCSYLSLWCCVYSNGARAWRISPTCSGATSSTIFSNLNRWDRKPIEFSPLCDDLITLDKLGLNSTPVYLLSFTQTFFLFHAQPARYNMGFGNRRGEDVFPPYCDQ